jgi:uncharacterized LabA/DUF88 family protein
MSFPIDMSMSTGVAVSPIAVGMRVGVFCDLSNIYQNGGVGMRYDVLRQYAQLYGDVLRLNAYLSYDAERGERDRVYRDKALGFQDALREMGWQVICKNVKWYDNDGARVGKANADVDLAVDILTSAANLDMIIVLTGDGDFVRPIQVVRDMGRRVEGIGLDNVSGDLKRAVDSYVSGFIIPNLVPLNKNADDESPCGPQPVWGAIGSYVRGVCTFHHPKESYGFFSFLPRLSRDHWLSDPRTPGSPFVSAFFHDSVLPAGVNSHSLTKRSVFEFQIERSDRENTFNAKNIRLVTSKS